MSSNLPVSHVKLTSQCARSLVSHALTTENEEVLGLLLGHYIEKDIDGLGGSVIVCGTHILRRHDKRPDRVEVTSSDLSLASQYAESLGLVVVGWYHSHPHITLHPSHVDLNTQHLYQYLNEKFIGIIISCFNKSKNEIGILAFQTFEKKSKYINTIQKLSKHRLEHSDEIKYGDDSSMVLKIKSMKYPIIYKNRESMSLIDDDIKRELEQFDDYYDQDQDNSRIEVNLPIIIIDDLDKINKENNLIIKDNSMEKMIDVINILYQEEKESFMNSISNQEKMNSKNMFVMMHHSAVYQKSLCRILEYIVFPYIKTLKKRKEEIENEIKRIKEEEKNHNKDDDKEDIIELNVS